ncbi:MAG TPA: tetratricopeptide repeat protein, partial [Myxococcaceae bacterium]|nr:tetratricopeptide repeat protein [Myxococcaceae bacterium]
VAPSVAEEVARQRITTLEREARALGNDPSAALLFHEIGLLWEDPLKNPRNAAVAYQQAFRVAPRFIANIQAARRLFAEVGNWQMVVQLLDAELAATDDTSRRAPLLFEKAVILQTRLSRDEEALKSLRQCLEARPRHVPLLVQLEAHFAEADDHAALVEIYRLLADSIADDSLRAHYLSQAAEILQHRLQRPEEASKTRRAAFALDKRDPLLLSAEIRSAEREGRHEELLAALAAEAELLGEHGAPSYLRIAKVYERLGRREDALAALLAARRVSPNEPLILSELAQIYEAQGRYEDLADVLLSWANCISDESELVALNLRLAALYEENLKRDDAAAERYRAILALVPGHRGALAGLGKLYHRLQEWEQLVAVFDAEFASLEEPREQAARMFKSAEILDAYLGRQEEAIQRYSRCLHLQPGYLPAHKALTRLYSELDRWSDLAALYEQDLLQTQDREETVAILQKMAALYEDRLQDIERASECLKRVLELEPENVPTIRNLARLYQRSRRWQELITLSQIEASLVRDTREVLSLHHKSAEIVEHELGDRAAAVSYWERLLSISPTYLPALQALGRLYAQDARWEDLIRMYRAEGEISPSPEQAAALIFKVGELQETKLSDVNAAVGSYQEVLTLAPAYLPALRALARIYRARGAWESLIEVLRSQAATRNDPAERANALFQAAAIWDDRLERPDLAIETYQEVLRLDPSHEAALRALERLYANSSDLKELVAVLDRAAQTGQTPTARIAAHLKLAQLYLDRLREPARAAKCAEAALSIDPANVTALKLLERVRAGDRVRRGELRARIAERVTDPKLRSALRLAAVADRDQPGAESAVEEMLEAFLANPGDGRLAFQLERALRRSGDFARLASVLAKRVELATDPQEKTALLLRAGDVNARLGARTQAVAAYEAALAISPGCVAALQGLRAVYADLSDWAKVRATAEAEAQAARDPLTAIDAWVIAADAAWRRLEDPDSALALYRKVLERDPLEPRASAGVEEIFQSRGGAAELAALQERRGEAMLAQKNMATAAGEFFAAAVAYATTLQDRQKAWLALDRALAAQPTHPSALELKAQLAIENGHFADAAHALALRVQQGGDAHRIAALHLQLGALYQDRLTDLTRAAAHLQTSLAANSRNAEALERLAGIHISARNWTGAADCLKRLLELGGPPADMARRIIALAHVLDEGMGDAVQATALYRRALEMAPGDEVVIQRLIELYEKMGNLRGLVELLEDQAQHAPDPHRAAQLRVRMAEIYAGPLGDPQRAVSQYRVLV